MRILLSSNFNILFLFTEPIVKLYKSRPRVQDTEIEKDENVPYDTLWCFAVSHSKNAARLKVKDNPPTGPLLGMFVRMTATSNPDVVEILVEDEKKQWKSFLRRASKFYFEALRLQKMTKDVNVISLGFPSRKCITGDLSAHELVNKSVEMRCVWENIHETMDKTIILPRTWFADKCITETGDVTLDKNLVFKVNNKNLPGMIKELEKGKAQQAATVEVNDKAITVAGETSLVEPTKQGSPKGDNDQNDVDEGEEEGADDGKLLPSKNNKRLRNLILDSPTRKRKPADDTVPSPTVKSSTASSNKDSVATSTNSRQIEQQGPLHQSKKKKQDPKKKQDLTKKALKEY